MTGLAALLVLGACAGGARPAEPERAPSTSADAPADEEVPAQTAVSAMPASSVEGRLLADLDRRLADPADYRRLVGGETGSFYEGGLFPYVLPTLAMASLSRRPGADAEALRARMAKLIDLLIPEVVRALNVSSAAGIPGVQGMATWQGQLALALGAWKLAGGDDRYEALQAPLDAALLAAVQARGGAPIDAYPGMRWGFDTVPVLLALRLRDREVGLPGAEQAIQAHLRWMDTHVDSITGLPPAQLDFDSGAMVEGPRGCDLSLRVALLAQRDRARGEKMYKAYTQHFSVSSLGISGFGEWPDGKSGTADPDSGPVLMGLGMAATGLGLGAVRAARDSERFARLDAELATFPQLARPLQPMVAPEARRLGIVFDLDQFVTGFLFGDAALLWSVTWEDWGVGG